MDIGRNVAIEERKQEVESASGEGAHLICLYGLEWHWWAPGEESSHF
jgi:hypothetical protein